jgi:hypothetical protein
LTCWTFIVSQARWETQEEKLKDKNGPDGTHEN